MLNRAAHDLLPIGQLASRAGVSVATVRYYEQLGLIDSTRTVGGHRVFPRHTLRRLAVVTAGQRVGLTLQQIADTLQELPRDRPPTQAEWTTMSQNWAATVAKRIAVLQHLAADLDSCIGCGCLSLGKCALFNPDDSAAAEGASARWIRSAG